MVLRTRLDGGGRRAVFAAVSERYAACDVNLLADACGKAALQSGGEIRADVFYDRRKCSISLLAHSDVKPETCGVGETFQVGVRLQTDDTGKGGIRVAVLAFRNRCRNYYIIDEAVIRLASLRHIGDPTRLAAEVADRLGVAFAKISHFTRAWDAGANKRLWTADDLGIVTRATSNLRAERGSEKLLSELLDNAGRKMSAATLRDELLSGAFRGLAERKILPIGARLMEDEMPLLIKAHDDSRNAGSALRVGASLPTYASVANAVSLYAHDMQSDRLDEIELETAAGRILSMAAPLPWVAHKDQRV